MHVVSLIRDFTPSCGQMTDKECTAASLRQCCYLYLLLLLSLSHTYIHTYIQAAQKIFEKLK